MVSFLRENLHIEISIAVNLGYPAEHGTLVINSRRGFQTLLCPLHCGAGVAKENSGRNKTTRKETRELLASIVGVGPSCLFDLSQ